MGLTSYDAAILANASLVAYWDLNGNVNDTKGTNHLSGGTAGTYVGGIDGGQAMQFDGATQSISSASTIDLTATNKITTMLWVNFLTYDLTNAATIMESSANSGTNAGSIALWNDGATAGDPIRPFLRGDVGNASAEYKIPANGWMTDVWFHLTTVYDMSLATNEVSSYKNGILMTPETRVVNSNNTLNFGNYTFFLASRNNASLFGNIVLCKVAVFNTALTAGAILSLYQAGQLGLLRRTKTPMAQKSIHTLKIE